MPGSESSYPEGLEEEGLCSFPIEPGWHHRVGGHAYLQEKLMSTMCWHEPGMT